MRRKSVTTNLILEDRIFLYETKHTETKHEIRQQSSTFKYLGEILEPTGKDKIAQHTILQKMKRALGRARDIFN